MSVWWEPATTGAIEKLMKWKMENEQWGANCKNQPDSGFQRLRGRNTKKAGVVEFLQLALHFPFFIPSNSRPFSSASASKSKNEKWREMESAFSLCPFIPLPLYPCFLPLFFRHIFHPVSNLFELRFQVEKCLGNIRIEMLAGLLHDYVARDSVRVSRFVGTGGS